MRRHPPPLRVVAAVWIRGGRVFCARRSPTQSHSGNWELPGGKVEDGETESVAIRREIQEELGLNLRTVRRLGASAWSYGHRQILLCAWLCRQSRGRPLLQEHDELAWLGPRELAGRRWAPADVPLLRLVARALAAASRRRARIRSAARRGPSARRTR